MLVCFLSAMAFHSPAISLRVGSPSRVASPILQATAEKMSVAQAASFYSSNPGIDESEKTAFLKSQGVSDFVIAQASCAASGMEKTVAGHPGEETAAAPSASPPSDNVDWSMVAFGLAAPPAGFTPPKKAASTVQSWYDGGQRLASFKSRAPAGWGPIPMAAIEAEYTAITSSLKSKTALVARLQSELEAEQKQLAKVAGARADVYRFSVESERQKAASAAQDTSATKAKTTAKTTATATRGASGGGDVNGAALGGLAAVAAAAAAYYFKVSGGADPASLVDAAAKATGA